MKNTLVVGQKIYFNSEVRPYTVKAVGDEFAICTKPFNLRHTVLYTILDFKQEIRSTNNLVFNCYDYAKQSAIDECLHDLRIGLVALSTRNQVPLSIIHRERIPI